MNRRQLVAAGLSSVATVVSGCSGRTEGNQTPERNLSEPDEPPAWAADGVVDLDAIYSNTVAELTGGPLSFEKRLLAREQTALPGDGGVLEEEVVRLRSDSDRELGSYLSATEPDGGISGDPRTAGAIEERYYADGTSYYYSNGGSYPSYGIDDGPFETFVEQVGEELVLLFNREDQIVFEEPLWDEANGVYVVQGTGIDDSRLANNIELNTCEMHIDEAGVFSSGSLGVSINNETDGRVESTVSYPESVDISEPDWIPENVGRLSVEVTIEDGSWKFVYGQRDVSTGELILPANHIVELRTTGEHDYHQTLSLIPFVKLNLVPGSERSYEIYTAEELVGESFDAYASEISPNLLSDRQKLTTKMTIVARDEFEERVENNQ